MNNMKKSHLVIISFQVAIIAIIIVMLGNQTMMLREIREQVTKPQQEIDLTVRSQGAVLDLPNSSFVLFEGDIWHEEELDIRGTGSDLAFPLLSIDRQSREGLGLDAFAVSHRQLGEGSLDQLQTFASNSGNYYRNETLADQPTLHLFIAEKFPVHTWYMVDPNDDNYVYIFTTLSDASTESYFYASWILETLRFE